MSSISVSAARAAGGLEPADTTRLLELFAACFGNLRSREQFEWRYERSRGDSAFHLARIGGRVVGAVATQGLPGWILGERAMVGRGADLMVDPAYRGRGIAQALCASGGVSLRAYPAVVHFPAEVTFLLDKDPDTTVKRAGQMPQWVRWERPGALREDRQALPRLLAVTAAAGFHAAGGATSMLTRDARCREIAIAEFDDLAGAFDRLDVRSHEIAPCIMSRDAGHLRWRWLDRPDPWRVVVAQESGAGTRALTGYAAFRILDGDCRIGDIMCFEPGTMRALLSTVRARTGAERPGRTVLDLNDGRTWTRRVLRQAGFLRRGVGPAVSLRALREDLPLSLEGLSSWYLTAGDTDLV